MAGRKGRYGSYGGQYVPETLMGPLSELEKAWDRARKDLSFRHELKNLLSQYAGRPTPLFEAKNLTRLSKGARIFLKREDLLHTGAHKINNTLGQALLARRLSKHRLIAETGAGQHGVATATVAALMGMSCEIFMGSRDAERQSLNLFRIRLLGASVRIIDSGSSTLKDAMNEAIRDWVTNVESTHYLIGSVAGPHPYPEIVREFQSVIGKETKLQIKALGRERPHALVASVGGGSNAIGLWAPFLRDKRVKLFGVEAAGQGILTHRHAATLTRGRPGVLHGSYSYLLQDSNGQVSPAHSISAGLDYPGVGPEHSHLKDSGRARYVSVNDHQALEACRVLALEEGIIPALESAHALSYAMRLAKSMPKSAVLVVNLSGRGDKDINTLRKELG